MRSKGWFPLYVSILVKRTLLKPILMREPWLENWGKRKKMFSFVVSKIFSPYYTSSKAFAYSLSKG